MIQERLKRLRQKMKEAGVTVYVVPSSDCHESEYVCGHFRARAYMTGFTGSAGTAVITLHEAGLWTDGRYFIQAEQQLKGSGVALYRMGEPGVPTVEEFVEQRLQADGMLGFDGRTMGAFRAEKFEAIAQKKGTSLYVTEDLVGTIWDDRPQIPTAETWVLETCWSGEDTNDKLTRVRTEMKKQGADVHVLASLCDIAWLLNIRGNDIPCVPVVLSFLMMTQDTCCWYVRKSVLTEEICRYLEEKQVQVKDYDAVYEDLRELKAGQKVLLDKRNVNYRLLSDISKDAAILNRKNPTELMKAMKNETELQNLRIAHRKEGIAYTKFMYWLKTNVGKLPMTELLAAEKLNEFRMQQEHALGQSFAPISAYGSNAAIVHYSPTKESDTSIRAEGFLLVDAGGHYLEGSTDTTRTFAVGPLTQEEKQMFTAVCRGNLKLANAKFLYGCTGYTLDILCREPLWQMGVDYKHGTGHGVGYLLNIHEGPNGIRWKIPEGEQPTALEAGMVTSDEPGIYIEGKYGIRTENELVCIKAEENIYGQFMVFENLTLVPIDLDAVLPEEMSLEERAYLNAYHKKVYEELSCYLTPEEREWLKIYTREV